MTQFRLYDSPQSFVYDSPQSFLHGVTVPEAGCYLPDYQVNGYALVTQEFKAVNDITNCLDVGAGSQLRDADITLAFHFTAPPVLTTFGRELVRFRAGFASSLPIEEFIKPSQIRRGILKGVESGATTNISEGIPVNVSERGVTSLVVLGCYLYDPTPLPLVMTLSGVVNHTRARTIWYNTYQIPTGNASVGDVLELQYVENIYGPSPSQVQAGDQIDWEASGYFLPGEECYFEGCPPPFYPTPYTATYSSSVAIFPGGIAGWPNPCGGAPEDLPAGDYAQYNTGTFDLAGNTVAFDFADAFVVRTDGGGSFSFPGCDVTTASYGPPGPDGAMWGWNNLQRGASIVHNSIYGAVGRKPVTLPFTPLWGPGVQDVYLWFPGAPAA